MKFDNVIINPPYRNGLCNRFYESALDAASDDGKVMWVGPATWLLGNKGRKITDKVDGHYTEITDVIPEEYFDIRMAQVMSAVYIDKLRKEPRIRYNGKEYKECSEISTFSHDDILVSVYGKIGCGGLADHIGAHVYRDEGTQPFSGSTVISDPDPEWWCMRIPRFRGNSNAKSRRTGEFYTIMSRNMGFNEICMQYRDFSDKCCYTAFGTEAELRNFFDYARTDFVRICLYLRKTSLALERGVLKYIPWQDFTEHWDDKKLFDKYGITEEEIRHIYGVLPNYYGIGRLY